MDSKEILDAFYAGLNEVGAEGPEAVLRWTGEQLAAAGERLRTAEGDTRAARAAELLVIAYPHVESLSGAGMADEALATQVMALLTVLHARVSPEEFPALYLQSLEALCLKASEYVYSVTPDRAMRASQLSASVFGLFIATAHDYIPRFGASDEIRRFYDHLRHISAGSGEDVTHFRGHRIVPTLAIDILTYAALELGVGKEGQ